MDSITLPGPQAEEEEGERVETHDALHVRKRLLDAPAPAASMRARPSVPAQGGTGILYLETVHLPGKHPFIGQLRCGDSHDVVVTVRSCWCFFSTGRELHIRAVDVKLRRRSLRIEETTGVLMIGHESRKAVVLGVIEQDLRVDRIERERVRPP